MNLNVVVITGRLTREPELRSIPSGTSVCDLSIAINSREKRGEDWRDRVDFIDVTVWGKQGENCAQYLSKGRQVAVRGRLRQERWETDGGDKRTKVKVVADQGGVEFLGDKGDNGGSSQRQSDVPADTSEYTSTERERSEDDIPF